MPKIYDWNGTTATPVKKAYDWNGTTATPIKKGYDHNGTASSLVYQNKPNPMSKTLSVSTLQGRNEFNTNTTKFSVPDGYETITITSFTPGQSFGMCYSRVYCIGDAATCMRYYYRVYNGVGFDSSERVTPITTLTKPEGIKEVSITLDAHYNSNVSDQFTSTASVTFTLS